MTVADVKDSPPRASDKCVEGRRSFFEPADPGAGEWVAAQAVKILEGKAAAGVRCRASTVGYSPAEPAARMPAPAA